MGAKQRKHVPLRTCIACGQKLPKRDLLRIVRSPDGLLQIDPRGKLPGRGAYICPNTDCWKISVDRGRLSRSLKCRIDPGEVRDLDGVLGEYLDPDQGDNEQLSGSIVRQGAKATDS